MRLGCGTALAQPYVGPGKCTDCHDHKDEKEWSEKRDGDGRGKQHINAMNQLSRCRSRRDGPKRSGSPNEYDVKGTCVKCHATVVRGGPGIRHQLRKLSRPGPRLPGAAPGKRGRVPESHQARDEGHPEEARDTGRATA